MDAAIVIERLELIFYERGAPSELLADNATAFHSRSFAAFASRWEVRLCFRAVYRPSGNSIVERNHRTVKVIAARKQCSVAEAVHLYNVSPRDAGSESTAPVRGVYRYAVRDCLRHSPVKNEPPPGHDLIEGVDARMKFSVGDSVWARKPGTRCTDESKPGIVTRVISPQVVEVNGAPWHVRDLRHRKNPAAGGVKDVSACREPPNTELEPPLYITAPAPWLVAPTVNSQSDNGASGQVEPRPSDSEESRSTASSDVCFVTPDAVSLEDPINSVIQEEGSTVDVATEVTTPSPEVLRRSTRVRRPPDRLTY